MSSTLLDMIISTYNTSHAATDYHSELATLHKFVVTLVTTLLEELELPHTCSSLK